ELLHNSLGALAEKLGPVFMIRVGVHRSVVVSSWEVAKECYTTNDKFFASRPSSTAAQIIGYNYISFGVAPYGPFWRHMRKIIMSELLSKSRIDSLKHVRDTEINTSMKELYIKCCAGNNNEATAPVLVEMKNWFGETALNAMLMMIVGKRYSSEWSDLKAFRSSMRSFMKSMGAFVIGEPFPFLKWWDLGGHIK
ncbi:cytochrome P450, partial [Ralstonia pseudosolanacearum]|uniref:cytochrome P450 n=1 Tax=Ralstonia pseudosolanacearum TaxID=1310165 RepID=UPI003D178548